MFERTDPLDLQLVLVEQDRRLRRSLAGILEIDRHVRSVQATQDVEAAIAFVQAGLRPDAVLVDVDDSDGRLPRTVARLRAACTGVRIVALTDDPALAARALVAGADLAVGVSAAVDDVSRLIARVPNADGGVNS